MTWFKHTTCWTIVVAVAVVSGCTGPSTLGPNGFGQPGAQGFAVPQAQNFPGPDSPMTANSVPPSAPQFNQPQPNFGQRPARPPVPRQEASRHRGARSSSAIFGNVAAKFYPPPQRVAPAQPRPQPQPAPQNNPNIQLTSQTTPTLNAPNVGSIETLPSTGIQRPISNRILTIDMSQALAMGGANHLQIQLARERVIEAHAQLSRARATILPNLQLGVSWNKHEGRLQRAQGDVLEVTRNSLFVGGGAGLGNVPLAGGANGPPRLMVNLSLADAIFEPMVAQRQLAAEHSNESATMNDSLRDIATAYVNLVESHGKLAYTDEILRKSNDMVEPTKSFAQTGAGTQAAVDLARTEQAFWQQMTQDADRETRARSAELARLLRVDPQTRMIPADVQAVPVSLIDPNTPTDQLLAWGMSARPELSQTQALVDGSIQRLRQEQLRPWLPNVQAGASAGSFGGGPGTAFDNQASRSDVDLMAIWQLENFGVGTLARQRASASRMRQSEMAAVWVRDRVAAEIVTASNDVKSFQRQIDAARKSVMTARESYQKNLSRIQNGVGIPIELLQAIRALSTGLKTYNEAVANYNRAQVDLLRSIGRPPSAG